MFGQNLGCGPVCEPLSSVLKVCKSFQILFQSLFFCSNLSISTHIHVYVYMCVYNSFYYYLSIYACLFTSICLAFIVFLLRYIFLPIWLVFLARLDHASFRFFFLSYIFFIKFHLVFPSRT